MSVSAVLLAGGESRRMGQDKATLIFCGKPLWQIQIELLRNLKLMEILVSARADPAWRPPDCEFVADNPPSRGPLSGLAASLGQMHGTHLLALAIDLPFMTAEYLRSLCDRVEAGRGILPVIGDRAEPLAAIYPAEVYIDLLAALSGRDFSLQALTNNLAKTGKFRVVQVADDQQRLYRNLNHPEDLDRQKIA